MIADEMILIGRGRIVAQGSKAQLLQTSGTIARATDSAVLRDALVRAGFEVTTAADGSGLRVDAEPVQVGEVAARDGLTLVELRPAEGAGLEELFLELTSETQREGVVA
jgi:ABC-2 type transport system ATP-binding protein